MKLVGMVDSINLTNSLYVFHIYNVFSLYIFTLPAYNKEQLKSVLKRLFKNKYIKYYTRTNTCA